MCWLGRITAAIAKQWMKMKCKKSWPVHQAITAVLGWPTHVPTHNSGLKFNQGIKKKSKHTSSPGTFSTTVSRKSCKWNGFFYYFFRKLCIRWANSFWWSWNFEAAISKAVLLGSGMLCLEGRGREALFPNMALQIEAIWNCMQHCSQSLERSLDLKEASHVVPNMYTGKLLLFRSGKSRWALSLPRFHAQFCYWPSI